ncbi:MAG TPA: hypothetical protein VLX68_08595 [Chitinivibrionales bacterium]|nr:hypothetical protein [Chitinivibrionales bacterium]
MDDAMVSVIKSHVESELAKLPEGEKYYSEETGDFRDMFDIGPGTDLADELVPALKRSGLTVELTDEEGEEFIVFSRKA